LDVLHTGEAAVFTYAGCVRVYRNSVVAAAAEFVKKGDAEVLGVTRGAHHGNSFLGEEGLNGFERNVVRGHRVSSCLNSLPDKVIMLSRQKAVMRITSFGPE
jgi:hypothetical protein